MKPIKKPIFLAVTNEDPFWVGKTLKDATQSSSRSRKDFCRANFDHPLHLRQWVKEQGALVRGGTSHTRSV
jgi:hypothetical protein